MVTILQASTEHIPQLHKILAILDTNEYHVSSEAEISGFIAKGWYFVALERDIVVGAIALDPTQQSCLIQTIVSTRSGIGRQLIRFAIDKCRREGMPKLWCWSLARYQAKGFYEKMGFEEAYLLKKHFYGEDCYLFGHVIDL